MEGGSNTRVDPADPSKNSVLDVIILSRSLETHLEKLIIDEKYEYPMQYPVKVNDTYEMKRSDHLTLILHLKDLKTKGSHEKKSAK